MVMISVIMSVYNDAKYLEKSIQSILSQTFEDFEFIICMIVQLIPAYQ